MFSLIVQSRYYPHFFELEANQPFSVKLIFHILQQWIFPICYARFWKRVAALLWNEFIWNINTEHSK